MGDFVRKLMGGLVGIVLKVSYPTMPFIPKRDLKADSWRRKNRSNIANRDR